MNIDRFFRHHGLTRNPFDAEEARFDPVFEKLMDTTPGHPDFGKILGRLDRPSTAVVFGEKGSGKTAIRLMIARRVAAHNKEQPDKRTLVLAYDDLNPVLDRLANRRRSELGFSRAAKADPEKLLSKIRLEDHQDALVSMAVTRIVDALLESEDRVSEGAVELPNGPDAAIKKLSRPRRVELAALASLYDQPTSGAVALRWSKLRSKLKLSWLPNWPYLRNLSIALTAAAGGLLAWNYFREEPATWVPWAGWAALGLAVVGWGLWLRKHWLAWSLARKVRREVASVEREVGDLRMMLLDLPRKEVQTFPWPLLDEHDARYQLTRKLMGVLNELGYEHLLILVDRVDEPTLVHGRAERMKPIIWPMFDNKFLQQDGIGFKLLLPIELRHELHRESADFFQEARMDKQSMIDRLSWSGATLYDLASNRLQACLSEGDAAGDGDKPLHLLDLFDESVSRELVVDALDQMHQPRDAFKFLYQVVQEHCNTVSDDEAVFRIPRLTLEGVRRMQSQRVQDLSRGLAPA